MFNSSKLKAVYKEGDSVVVFQHCFIGSVEVQPRSSCRVEKVNIRGDNIQYKVRVLSTERSFKIGEDCLLRLCSEDSNSEAIIEGSDSEETSVKGYLSMLGFVGVLVMLFLFSGKFQ